MIVGQRQGSVSVDRYLGGLLMFVYQASRRYLLLMAVSAVAVGAIVQVFAGRAAPVYRGQALVELGAVDGKTLTKPASAIAAIETRSFRKRVLLAMGSLGGADSRQAGLVFDSLSARSDVGDVIAVSVRASDEKQVRQAIDAVMRVLDQKEETRRAQMVADINAQLAAFDTYLSNLMNIQESLLAQAKVPSADTTPLGTVLLLNLTSRNEEQQAGVRAGRLSLQARLGPDQTYSTRLIDDDFPISVVSGFGGRWRTTLFAVAITLIGFILFALLIGRKTAAQN